MWPDLRALHNLDLFVGQLFHDIRWHGEQISFNVNPVEKCVDDKTALALR